MAPTRPSESKTPYKDVLAAISTGIKKSTSHSLRPKVDLDKYCGVAGDDVASPCPKPLRDCQIHSRAQKRAVTGRTCSYDMLILAPAWTASAHACKSEEDNGEGSSKGVTKAEARGVEKHVYIGESIPMLEVPVAQKSRKGKEKAVREDSKETTPGDEAIPARPKGKKRGPKAWTALENEGM